MPGSTRSLTATATPSTVAAVPAQRRATARSDGDRPWRGWRRGTAARLPLLLLVVDAVALAGAVVVAQEFSVRVLALAAVVVVLFAIGGLYRPRLTPAVLEDLPAIFGRALVGGALVTTAALVLSEGVDGRLTLVFAMTFAVLSTVLRSTAYAAVRLARRRGRIGYSTLILGGGEVAGQLAKDLLEHPEIGLRPIGFLDDDPLLEEDRRPVPHLGGSADLVDVILDQQVHNVVVAFGSRRESEVVDLLRGCDRMACEIFFVPRLFEVHATSRDMEMAWGTPLVRMRRAPFRTPMWHLKRVMDIVLAGLALVVLAPVLAGCALLVRLTIGSPVLFRQERVGLDGRPFTLLKFCSMRPTAPGESAQLWNIGDDPRLTSSGRFLRRTSLDELPQLWNILRGDMSLVGPRPERPHFVDEFRVQFPRYMARHRVPAGLTGAAQVHGLRGDTSIAERARFDNVYIENWSLWEDVKLLLRTVKQVVAAAGR